jgi:hypothetical protein
MVFQTKQQCQMNNIVTIPVVFSATGVIHIMLNHGKNYLTLPPSSMFQVHKLVTQTKIVIKNNNNNVRASRLDNQILRVNWD